ncbi:DUF5655 domain-containing protein [Phenylobacterium ferrooxidans]|uniref:DUF5655 domain-containing protein n=1 Tax=Phenylobacterium ferrooxidans TaxID=2982689 RepID=A0ABW6CI49_9CAUL
MTVEDFFARHPEARAVHEAVQAAVEAIGPARVRVGKSQVGFSRAHPFAATWRPEQYLRRARAPLVLSVYLRRRDASPRWKEVVEPRPGRFTHHLELSSAQEVDDFVRACLAEAWKEAG